MRHIIAAEGGRSGAELVLNQAKLWQREVLGGESPTTDEDVVQKLESTQ